MSGTFGCKQCEYKTLSSKNFLEHLQKHQRGEILDFLGRSSVDETSLLPLNHYTIEDDIGVGYGDVQLKKSRTDFNNQLQYDDIGLRSFNNKNNNNNTLNVTLKRRNADDHGYNTAKHNKSGDNNIIRELFKCKNNNVKKFDSVNVPEPSLHIELEYQSNDPIIENIDCDPAVVANNEPKDLGRHVLPDGQVDFDLD